MSDPPLLLPLKPTARILRIPASWLAAEAEAGRIPHLKADTVLLFDVDLVQRILAERARQTPVAAGEAVQCAG
jgi:hypothetical protein